MNISTHTYSNSVAELHIDADSVKIEQDVTSLDAGKWRVDDSVIEGLVAASIEFSEFNKIDVWEWFNKFVMPSITTEQKEYIKECLEGELGE